MKKLIKEIGISRFTGIAGLAVLVIVFLVSLLFQNRRIEIAPAEIIFAGTANDADCCII